MDTWLAVIRAAAQENFAGMIEGPDGGCLAKEMAVRIEVDRGDSGSVEG